MHLRLFADASRIQFPPYCHRVHIALEEVKADYTLTTVDLLEKPEWYSLKVNPAGKVSSPLRSSLSPPY